MSARSLSLKRVLRRRARPGEAVDVVAGPRSQVAEAPPVDIAPNDPILAYFQTASGAVDLETLTLESPARDALRAAGVKMVVPLVTQGELIGLLNLGPRLSEQEYSADDRKLLDTLAGQAAPAVRVAQLVRQQEGEARERERIAQELKVATLIQQQFLPSELPDLPGWHVAAFYRPAREVGGDFYDFIELPDGRVGIVVGDVTDKGVPAALVMAMTQSLLSAEAPRLMSPSTILERVNELLVHDMPPKMFVTCFYMVLDPSTGRIEYANAGHDVPYIATSDGVVEMRATGMPLGLLPGMAYEQKEVTVSAGDSLLLHSDGLCEAHNPKREMFGFPRLMKAMGTRSGGVALIDELLGELDRFTGAEWEQEDDITLLTLQRSTHAHLAAGDGDERVLAEFSVPSEEDNERLAIAQVAEAVQDLGLEPAVLERLKTAVGETTMNAIEHGNRNRIELPVEVKVSTKGGSLSVTVADHGGGRPIPEAEVPDLEAKLTGEQSTRGWGLFLVKNMVDEMNVSSNDVHHTVELVLHLKGEPDGS